MSFHYNSEYLAFVYHFLIFTFCGLSKTLLQIIMYIPKFNFSNLGDWIEECYCNCFWKGDGRLIDT